MTVKTKDNKGNLSSRLLILIFVLLAAGILVTGHLFYSNYAKNYRTQVEQQLSAITDLKVGELVHWRKERLGNANQLYKNPAFSSVVQRYFEHPDDLDAQEQLRSWLTRFQAYDQYARVFLLDTQGVGRISVPDTAEPVPRHIPQDAYQVLQSGKVTVLDLERDEDTQQPHMVILIPIFIEKDSNVPLGVVVMRIDPYQYLYPLISRWPTPSMTAETLLVRRDGNDALFLNELKFQKDTALKLRISLDNIKMPAVQAALGHEGIMEGIGYNGAPVIADIRRIPDSPWFMVARMDISEVYAPLTQMLWLIIALVGALLIGAGAGVGLVWRQQNIRVYKKRAEIADALQESEAKYRLLADNTVDGVWLLDMNLKLIYCSPSSEKQSGFTLQEIMEMSLEQYFTPESLKVVAEAFLEAVPKVEADPDYNPILTLELEFYKKDGTAFWAESKFSIVRDKHGKPVSILGQARDITERKQAEEELNIQNSLLTAVVNSTADTLIFAVDREYCYIAFNENHQSEMRKVWNADIKIGMNLLDCMTIPELRAAAKQSIDRTLTGVHFMEEQLQPDKDIFYEFGWNPVRRKDESISGVTCFIRDITERKHAEKALHESELRYRDLVNFSKNGVAVYAAAADGEDFIFKDFNRAAEGIDNVKKEDIIGKSILQAFPDVKEFGLFEVLQRVWRTGVPERYAITLYHDERISGWRDNYVYRLSSGEIVAIYEDVTARKQAEEALRESEALLTEAQGVAHIGHWELDLATMIPAWSEEIFHIFGIDPAKGEPSMAAHRDLLHPDDWDILNNAVSATSTTGAPFDIEFRLLHPLKGIRWMLAIGRAIRNDKGNISRLFGTGQDITNSKNIEENLEKSRQELRSLSVHLVSLREEERTLLAREIHDELGQALTALKMDLSWLSKKLPEGPHGGKIASMLKLVDITVKTVKRLATELRPGLLDDLGLVAAMEWQAGEFQERTGIKTELSFEPDDIMVDNEQATALFRIFQEVLTNVIRHAAATRVNAYLREKDGVLELSMRDNGKGIEQKMINSPKSLGLIGMRERCHHLGGTIDIRGKPGKGTTVTVNLPAREMQQ